MTMRLNKYLASCGVGSRRKVEELIVTGRVEVNNKTIVDLASQVNEETDHVKVDGQKLAPRRHVYYLLNKPKGVITTTADERDRKTVVDLIDTKDIIFPVGRLDYNTTGVLFLTNDGDFSNLVTHPRNKIPREYEVQLDKPLDDNDKEKLLKGIYIEGERGRFKQIVFPKKNHFTNVIVTAVEGRNHFVKKMFAALSYTVKNLNRISFAGIRADIPIGNYRKLTQHEIDEVIHKYGR
ncbi:MAG: pseudouridine synthase [Ignavibacteriaceae bacterium]|nr:pseudouridine synthase [Ignavibacteriaceae bacterium]